MHNSEEVIELMHQAKAFRQPIVAKYIQAVEQKLFNEWTHSEDEKHRETLYLQALALKEFEKFIKHTIINGEQAEREINEKVEKEKQALTQ